MFHNLPRDKSTFATRRHQRYPRLEGLEERLLLYGVNGGQWVYGSRITYSFVPDGTSVGGIASTLDQTMAQRGISTQSWQDAFRRAAAVWQSVANVNLVQVSDDGSALGVNGNQQNDARFGDMRIAGINVGQGVLGLAYLPPPINGGSLAGDIVLNTAIAWNINSNSDVMTVALHEIGHSLGMDHSTIQTAVMYASYTGVKQTLSTDDTNGIRSLYSARQNDAFDAARSNDMYTTATNITPYVDGNAQILLAGLDITTTADSDWYAVVAPSNTNGTIKVTMQSSQLSSLSPKLLLYSSSLVTLGQATSTSFGDTVSITLTGIRAGQGFYIRAMAGSATAATGNYGLLLNFGSSPQDPIAPPDTTVGSQGNQGGGSMNMSEASGLMNRMGRGNGPPASRIVIGNLVGYGDELTLPEFGHEDHDGQSVSRTSVFALATQTVLASPPVQAGWTEVTDWSGGSASTRAKPNKTTLNQVIDRAIDAWL